MNKVFMLYSPDYECPVLIETFDKQELAYDYAKKILNADIVSPVDKRVVTDNDYFGCNYFIQEVSVKSDFPNTYVDIHTYYEPYEDEIKTHISYINADKEIKKDGKYEESQSEHEDSITLFLKVNSETNIDKIVQTIEDALKNKLKNTIALAVTNDKNYNYTEFYEKVKIDYPISPETELKYFDENGNKLDYVLLGLYKKENNIDIQTIKKEDLIVKLL
jgi:hypothetical protein